VIDSSCSLHPTAVIDEPCDIGAGTSIWHFCHVSSGAQIGPGCVIGQGCFVASTAKLGRGVRLQNHVSVYDGVTLEDEVFCGPQVVFTNVLNPRAHISRKHEYRPTLVKRRATLGANSTIVCGHTIGRGSFVGAGAVVTKDVPDFALVVGVPARRVGWLCACGVRLDSTLACSCGARYRAGTNGIEAAP
jgi:UDP-2-acetamido-3-amino-2,3-dideoxy-glucuronate N-acetyltransferase